MFGAAVARPRQNPETGEWWDGRVYFSSFTRREAAVRNSRHRPAGTLVTKPVSVNREVYCEWLCFDVVTAAIAQWPDWVPRKIKIQQDNAKPHIRLNDPTWLEVQAFYARPENGGWQLELCFQPPNSPDLNILDLAMFRAMQSIQQQHQTKNIDELIAIVKQVWESFPLETSKKVWTSLQMVMNAIISVDGKNHYKLPHMAKDKWIREHGDLPLRLQCTVTQAEQEDDKEEADPVPQEAAAPPSPPANNVETAQVNTSPTGVHELPELTGFHNLSLQAVAEEDLWDDMGGNLEWDDNAGHDDEGGD